MKPSWQTSKLGDLLAVLRNEVNCKQDKGGNGDKISRIESIADASFNLEKVGYTTLSAGEKERYRLEIGDILFSHINSVAHVGKTAVFHCPEPVYHGVNLLLMRPKDVVTSAYLEHSLKYLYQSGYWSKVCKQSVNQASVNQQDISKVGITYPRSITEQERIVGILDEAFEGIATAKANAKKNLQNARALFDSHLQRVFAEWGTSWKLKTLQEIATNFGRGKSRHRPRNAKHLYGGKYPFVQTGDIRNAEHVVNEYSQTYSEAGLAQSKLWPKGTICVTIAANIAETAILGFDACFPDSVIGLVADPNEANVGYIEYLLQAYKVRLQSLGKGSAQANINMATFENQRFPFPPVDDQLTIVIKFDSLSKETQRLVNIYEHKIAALDALKTSLLHKAFTGEF